MSSGITVAERVRTTGRPVRKVIPEAGLAEGRAYAAAKRASDVVLSLLGIVALAPLGVTVALLIKLAGPGPVFFVQRRVGRGGKPFPFVKFRSMVVGADRMKANLCGLSHHGEEDITFKIKRDPRVTWIGALLRKTSIDELPQLWNVLRGEMSLVGPRPAVPAEVARYAPRHRGRLAVKPGLTCTWQVRGRGDIPFEQQVAMDLDYIRCRSLWYDLLLIAETVPAVVRGHGAY